MRKAGERKCCASSPPTTVHSLPTPTTEALRYIQARSLVPTVFRRRPRIDLLPHGAASSLSSNSNLFSNKGLAGQKTNATKRMARLERSGRECLPRVNPVARLEEPLSKTIIEDQGATDMYSDLMHMVIRRRETIVALAASVPIRGYSRSSRNLTRYRPSASDKTFSPISAFSSASSVSESHVVVDPRFLDRASSLGRPFPTCE